MSDSAFVLIGTLILIVSAPALASAENQTESIEEIQVTATRRPVDADATSAALSLIDREALKGAKLIVDALAAQPGLFLQQTTPGQGAAILRGLKGSEVLHLVDGLRLNNAIFRNAPTQYLALVSPASVERIEALRGSPGSLYGSDAIGGVVQVINRVPSFDGLTPQIRGEAGMSFDTAEQQRSANLVVEYGTERAAGLFAASYLDTGNRRIGGGARVAPSGYSARAFRAALALTPDDATRWLLDWQFGEQPKTPRVDELVAGFGQAEPASSEFLFAPNSRNFLHLRHDREGGWLNANWRMDVAWQRISDDRVSRDFGSDSRRLEDNASDLYGLTVTANANLGSLNWVLGAEAYYDEVSSRRRELDLSAGSVEQVQSRFPDGSTVRQLAVFAHGDLAVGERSSVSGGLRASSISVALGDAGASPAATVDTDDLSADLGWRYALTDALSVVGNASFGFRAPNVFDLGTLGERPGNRFNIPNAGLESERVRQADIGVRFRDNQWRADFVAWRLDYDDRITSVLTGELTPDGRQVVQSQNVARAELWGLEALISWSHSDWLGAELVLNHTRGEQRRRSELPEPADRVPPLNGRLSLVFDAGAWRISPTVEFAAKQNRLSARDRNDPRINPQGTDGWIIASVRLDWQPSAQWALSVGASNLADVRYRRHGSGIDAPGVNAFANIRYFWR